MTSMVMSNRPNLVPLSSHVDLSFLVPGWLSSAAGFGVGRLTYVASWSFICHFANSGPVNMVRPEVIILPPLSFHTGEYRVC